jgi:hypothetical protein
VRVTMSEWQMADWGHCVVVAGGPGGAAWALAAASLCGRCTSCDTLAADGGGGGGGHVVCIAPMWWWARGTVADV